MGEHYYFCIFLASYKFYFDYNYFWMILIFRFLDEIISHYFYNNPLKSKLKALNMNKNRTTKKLI